MSAARPLRRRGPSIRRGELLEPLLDATLHRLGHPLEGQALLDTLYGAGNGRLDALDALLDGRGEVVDVLLPARCPFGGLLLHALVGAGHDHVEGGEDTGAGGAHDEDFGALGARKTRDACRHDGLVVVVDVDVGLGVGFGEADEGGE
jgi:hypothetical protein